MLAQKLLESYVFITLKTRHKSIIIIVLDYL